MRELIFKFEAEIHRLRWFTAFNNFQTAVRRYALAQRKANFNPAQPRVPAGNRDGGQWTAESDGTSSNQPTIKPTGMQRTRLAQAQGLNDQHIVSDAAPGVQLAENTKPSGYPIDLHEEHALGGHTIERHVGKSEEALLSAVRWAAAKYRELGGYAVGLTQGSFPSLETATKLINSTLAANQSIVDLVATGAIPRATLDQRFGSKTGYEAFAQTERSQPYIRDTYGVRVVIVPDARASKGYRVDTAFPIR